MSSQSAEFDEFCALPNLLSFNKVSELTNALGAQVRICYLWAENI